MLLYQPLEKEPTADRKRIAGNILKLREQLTEIPKRTVKDTLLLATWNIRNFGQSQFSPGGRLTQSFYYIAEIISAFDLVAIQEVYQDLTAIKKLIKILGPSWSYFASSTSFKRSANHSRLVFLYDRRKVQFTNIAGQVVLDEEDLILGKYQFARPPYIASFQSGSFQFSLCAVHIWYGGMTAEKMERRVAEIDKVSSLMAKKVKFEKSNIILLGDFNIVSPEHPTMEALTKHGFTVPKELQLPSNIRGTHFYDQIAFFVKEKELQIGDSNPSSGAFNYFNTVFREEDYAAYLKVPGLKAHFEKKKDRFDTVQKKKRFYLNYWRTFQMSDHLPLWVELKIDFTNDRTKLLYELEI